MSMSVANSSTYINEPVRRGSGESNTALLGKKTNNEKKLMILAAVLAVLTISFVVALAVVATQKNANGTKTIDVTTTSGVVTTGHSDVTTTTAKPGVVCNTLPCLKSAVMILENMNQSADPCEDFYEFVCGTWDKNNDIPEDKGSIGVIDGLEDDLSKTCIALLERRDPFVSPLGAIDNARALYQSCITTDEVSNDDGVKQIQELLATANISLTLTPDQSTVASKIDSSPLSTILKNFGLNLILSFTVEADGKNTSSNVITLDQPAAFGLSRTVLVNGSDTDRIKAYKKYIEQTFCLPNLITIGNCDATKAANGIFDFEVEIAKKSRSAVDRRSASSWYHPMPLEELIKSVPQIPFAKYITDILGDKGKDVTNKTIVIVKEMKYFQEVAKIFLATNTSVIENYLGWRLVQSLGPPLFKGLRDIEFQFNQVDGGIQKQQDNQARCFDMTNTFLGHAVGRLYVDKKFDKAGKKDVEDMVNHLADGFRQLVNGNSWMDEQTRNLSKAKLEEMISMIGYPDWIESDSKLNEYYSGISSLNQSNFFPNFVNVLSFTVELSLQNINKMNNRTADWSTQASIVNAYYNPSANSITFPAGILQVPFFGERPKVLNYGAIGIVIGHEITHGFDDQGSEYDGDGNLFDWWTNETRQEFDKRKQCFIDQYSNIKDPLSGKNLNGAQTIGENIADNGGVREAYNAYILSGREEIILPGLESYNDQKLFYISAGNVWCTKFRKEAMENKIDQDVHSPGIYRASVPLSNSEDFAKVFQCPVGSKMNPKERCVIW